MIGCEICNRDIPDDQVVEITVQEDKSGHVVFHVHERCILAMGKTTRRLLQDLRTQKSAA